MFTTSVGSPVFAFNLCTGFIALFFTPFVWQTLNISMLLMIREIGILALTGYLCLALALSWSQTSQVVSFEYPSLIWAVIIELMVWHFYLRNKLLLVVLLSSAAVSMSFIVKTCEELDERTLHER